MVLVSNVYTTLRYSDVVVRFSVSFLSCGLCICIGCEFFKDYRDNGYNAVALKFDWSQVCMPSFFKFISYLVERRNSEI